MKVITLATMLLLAISMDYCHGFDWASYGAFPSLDFGPLQVYIDADESLANLVTGWDCQDK